MTDVLTFPCEYLVISSGYTDRLVDGEKHEELSKFCAVNGVIPLYVLDRI